MLLDSTLMILFSVLFGASLATNYWLYQLWQTAAWKTKQLELALWNELPEPNYGGVDLSELFDED